MSLRSLWIAPKGISRGLKGSNEGFIQIEKRDKVDSRDFKEKGVYVGRTAIMYFRGCRRGFCGYQDGEQKVHELLHLNAFQICLPLQSAPHSSWRRREILALKCIKKFRKIEDWRANGVIKSEHYCGTRVIYSTKLPIISKNFTFSEIFVFAESEFFVFAISTNQNRKMSCFALHMFKKTTY